MSQAGVTSTTSSQQYVRYISPSINFTNTGATTIFTNGSSNFVVDQIIFLVDTVVNFSGGFTANVGFTAAAYSDYLSSYVTSLQDQSTYDIIDISGGEDAGIFPYLPASTALRVNVTSGAIADTFTGRVLISGFIV